MDVDGVDFLDDALLKLDFANYPPVFFANKKIA